MKYTFLFCAVTAFISCQKSGGNEFHNPYKTSCDEITTVAFYGDSTRISYDGSGRVTEVVGEGYNHSVYSYFRDSIRLQATDVNNMDISVTYFLDKKGRVSRTSFFDYQYQYDGQNHLIYYRQPYGVNPGEVLGFTPYYLTYENDNLTTVSTPDSTVSRQKISFYYYDGINQDMLGYNAPLYISGVLGDRNSFYLIKGGFFGAVSKSLYKTADFYDGYGPGSGIVYDYDSSGRISGTTYGYQFIYKCP